MGLNAALVDKARILTPSPQAEKVDGTTTFTDEAGSWFRCRLTLPSGARTAAGLRVVGNLGGHEDVRAPTVERPFILFGIRDLDGGSLVDDNDLCLVNSTVRIEIDSPQLGNWVYEAVEDATPIRKKRKIIGFSCGVAKLREHPFTPVETP